MDETYVQLRKELLASSSEAHELAKALEASDLSDGDRSHLEEAHRAACVRFSAAEAAAIKRKWEIAKINEKLRRRKASVYYPSTCPLPD